MDKMNFRRFLRRLAVLAVTVAFVCTGALCAGAENAKQTYTATRTKTSTDDGYKITYTTTETVTYQVGTATVTVEQVKTENGTLPSGAPWYAESKTRTRTYTLSAPLQAAQRQGEWNLLLDVPAGTVVTCVDAWHVTSQGSGGTADDGWNDDHVALTWYQTKKVLTGPMVEEPAECKDIVDVGWGDSPLTVAKDALYQIVDMGEDLDWGAGGFVFHGV